MFAQRAAAHAHMRRAGADEDPASEGGGVATRDEIIKEEHDKAKQLDAAWLEYEASRARPDDHSGLSRAYIQLADRLYGLVRSAPFEKAILCAIFVACVLIGIQTYPGMEADAGVRLCDSIILCVFSLEILLKIVASSTQPWMYFCNPGWRWNCFDLLIVVLCMPFMNLGGTAAVLRLVRLMRVVRVVQKIPKLRVLLMGMFGGLKSIMYISLLISLIMYMYALCGIFLFRENDPWHFGSFGISMTTLFRITTLEDWSDIMYVNFYGCAKFSAQIYTLTMAESELGFTARSQTTLCATPQARPVLTAVYFVSFVLLSALVMLSMFVGAIIASMSESIAAINQERVDQLRLKKELSKRNIVAQMQEVDHEELRKSKKVMPVDEVNRLNRLGAVLLEAWDGEPHEWEQVREGTPLRRKWSEIGDAANAVATNRMFEGYIMLLICLTAGVLAADTDTAVAADDSWVAFAGAWNTIITASFTVEVVLKLVAQKFRPLHFFHDAWNVFDFIVVLGSYLPGAGDMLLVLRMVRLLLILKLIKRVRELRVAVLSLHKAMGSIGYIGLCLLICFFFFSIFGIILFQDNDPWHFGNLHLAMLTLFRCATLEDWTDIMYINMYGCDKYGYRASADIPRAACTKPHAHGYVATAFFMVFVVIGAMVMLNLFIGVITTSMEESARELQREEKVQDNVERLQDSKGVTDDTIRLYREVFKLLDTDGNKSVDLSELRLGLNCAGRFPTIPQLRKMMAVVDSNDTNEIDFAEFCEFLSNVRVWDTGADMSFGAQIGRGVHDVAMLGAHLVGGVGKVLTTAAHASLEQGQEHAESIDMFNHHRHGAGVGDHGRDRKVELVKTHVADGTQLRQDRSLLSQTGSARDMGKMLMGIKASRNMVGSPGRGASAAAAQLLSMPAAPLEGRGAPRMHSNPMNAPAAPGDAVDRMLGQIMGFVKTRPEIAGAGANVSRRAATAAAACASAARASAARAPPRMAMLTLAAAPPPQPRRRCSSCLRCFTRATQARTIRKLAPPSTRWWPSWV